MSNALLKSLGAPLSLWLLHDFQTAGVKGTLWPSNPATDAILKKGGGEGEKKRP